MGLRGKIIIAALLIFTIVLIPLPAKATLFWEPNTGSKISNFTDDDNRAISLGFSVNFYGTSYSTVYVNSNGSVTFGDGNNDPTNVSFPATEVIDGTGWNAPGDERTMIAPLWDDLDPDPADTGRSTSGVYTNIIGNPGSRKFVVTWNDVTNYNRSTGLYYGSDTFQLEIYEWTNSIQFNYQSLSGIKSTKHVSPKDINGITIGVNAGDLLTDSLKKGTQYLYGFVPSSSLPENNSLLVSYNPNYYGTGKGGYTIGIQTNQLIPPSPAPEPSTLALLGLGILAGIFVKRRIS